MNPVGAIYYFVGCLIFLGASRGPQITGAKLFFALAVGIFWPIALPAIACYAIGKAISNSFPRF